MKEKNQKTKGITLIALVITIIVLLILAGVSIAMLTGQNGILTQAQNASEQTEVGAEKEAISLAYIGATANKEGNGAVTDTDMDDQFGLNGTKADAEGTSPIIVTFDESNRQYMIDENGNITGPLEAPEETPEPEAGGSIATMDYGVIEIKWLLGDTNYVSETPNAPTIKEDLPEGTTMELVRYENGNWVSGTDYNYVAGSGTEDNRESRWANAKVTIDGVESYFVWIPRYAYRIIYFSSQDTKDAYLTNGDTSGIIGYSDSRGIVDVNGRKVDGVESTTSLNVGDYFRVHPAFMNDSSNNYENGGWSTDLSGIWVGKYESSLVNKEDSSNIVTNDNRTGNILLSEHTDKSIAVQPGMSSWRYCTIGNMYTNAKAYSTDLNSHMLKNSEWGAVAYLTESKYGRNGTEVTINNSSEYITGSAQTTSGTTNDYKSAEGVLASSTGNVTGIYDLSGGAHEYVAAYYTGGNSTYLNYGRSLVNEIEKKYVTAYTGANVNSDYKLGDATYETSGYFVDWESPFFVRGGYFDDGSDAGVFSFFSNSGNAYGNYSFRMCLAVK